MKKESNEQPLGLESALKWLPPLALALSAVWFIAEIDTRITVLESKFTLLKENVHTFDQSLVERNKHQDDGIQRFEQDLRRRVNRLEDRKCLK